MIHVSKHILEQIAAHASIGLPNEVCGYLAGKEGRVTAHYKLTNIDETFDHFSMSPQEQFAAVKDMRRKGLDLMAVYHSHPETPARPSKEDIRLAYDPQISYVIISLAHKVPSIKSFRIKKGEVSNEEIEMFEI